MTLPCWQIRRQPTFGISVTVFLRPTLAKGLLRMQFVRSGGMRIARAGPIGHHRDTRWWFRHPPIVRSINTQLRNLRFGQSPQSLHATHPNRSDTSRDGQHRIRRPSAADRHCVPLRRERPPTRPTVGPRGSQAAPGTIPIPSPVGTGPSMVVPAFGDGTPPRTENSPWSHTLGLGRPED
jgi:hypothetical protein